MDTEQTPDSVAAAAPSPEENNHRLSEARRFAAEKYERIRSATSAQVAHVRRYTSDARAHLHDHWDTTCAKARDAHKVGESYVKQNPTMSVLTALGFGFLLGLIFGIRR